MEMHQGSGNSLEGVDIAADEEVQASEDHLR